MTTFTHLTIYINRNAKTNAALAALQRAIPQVPIVQGAEHKITPYQSIMKSESFISLSTQSHLFTTHADRLPTHTPESYQTVTYETLHPVAPDVAVLSIPIIHNRPDELNAIIQNDLTPVLFSLFGRSLFKIIRLSAPSGQSFYHQVVRDTLYEQPTGWRRWLSRH